MGTEVLDNDPRGGRRGLGPVARSPAVAVDLGLREDDSSPVGDGDTRLEERAGGLRRALRGLRGWAAADWARFLRVAGAMVAVVVVVAMSVQARADRAAQRTAASTLSVFAQASVEVESVAEAALTLRFDLLVANLGPRSVRVAEVRVAAESGARMARPPEDLGEVRAGEDRSGHVVLRWRCDDVSPAGEVAILETVVVTADGERHLVPVRIVGGDAQPWSGICFPDPQEGQYVDLRSEVVDRGRALRIVYEPTREGGRPIVPQRLVIRTLPGITLRTAPPPPIRLAEQPVVITVRPVVTDCLAVDARHMDLGEVGRLTLADGTEVAYAEGIGVVLGRAIEAACP